MAYTRTQAQKLLTTSELALFDAGRSTEIRKFDKTELRGKLERSRKLRDKYRDLYRRQRLAIRGATGSKSGARGTANQRTQQKEEILAEVVARMEARIAQIERQEDLDFEKAQRESTAASAQGLKKAVKKAVARKAAAKKGTARKAAAKRGGAATAAKVGNAKAARRNQSEAARAVEPKLAAKSTRSTVLSARQRAANARAQAKRDSR